MGQDLHATKNKPSTYIDSNILEYDFSTLVLLGVDTSIFGENSNFHKISNIQVQNSSCGQPSTSCRLKPYLE